MVTSRQTVTPAKEVGGVKITDFTGGGSVKTITDPSGRVVSRTFRSASGARITGDGLTEEEAFRLTRQAEEAARKRAEAERIAREKAAATEAQRLQEIQSRRIQAAGTPIEQREMITEIAKERGRPFTRFEIERELGKKGIMILRGQTLAEKEYFKATGISLSEERRKVRQETKEAQIISIPKKKSIIESTEAVTITKNIVGGVEPVEFEAKPAAPVPFVDFGKQKTGIVEDPIGGALSKVIFGRKKSEEEKVTIDEGLFGGKQIIGLPIESDLDRAIREAKAGKTTKMEAKPAAPVPFVDFGKQKTGIVEDPIGGAFSKGAGEVAGTFTTIGKTAYSLIPKSPEEIISIPSAVLLKGTESIKNVEKASVKFVTKGESPFTNVGPYIKENPERVIGRLLGEAALFRAGSATIVGVEKAAPAVGAAFKGKLLPVTKEITDVGKRAVVKNVPGIPGGVVTETSIEGFRTGFKTAEEVGQLAIIPRVRKRVGEVLDPAIKGAFKYTAEEQKEIISIQKSIDPAVTATGLPTKTGEISSFIPGPFKRARAATTELIKTGDISKATKVATGQKELNPGFYATPGIAGEGFVRESRLGLGQRAATFKDILTGKVTVRKTKPQIIIQEEATDVFPKKPTPSSELELRRDLPGTLEVVGRPGTILLKGEGVPIIVTKLQKAGALPVLEEATGKATTGTIIAASKIAKATSTPKAKISTVGFTEYPVQPRPLLRPSPIGGFIYDLSRFKTTKPKTTTAVSGPQYVSPIVSVDPYFTPASGPPNVISTGGTTYKSRVPPITQEITPPPSSGGPGSPPTRITTIPKPPPRRIFDFGGDFGRRRPIPRGKRRRFKPPIRSPSLLAITQNIRGTRPRSLERSSLVVRPILTRGKKKKKSGKKKKK